MFPIFSDSSSAGLAQPQQMRSGDYTSYTLPPGSTFMAVPAQQQQQHQQQQQQQQGGYVNSTSMLIDPPTTFLVHTQQPTHQQQQHQQQQQQKLQTLYAYPSSPHPTNNAPANVSVFSNSTTASSPVYASANIGGSTFGSAGAMQATDPSARSQRMGSILNSVPTPPQQQQQPLPSVYMHNATAPIMAPSFVQQQQQRGNSLSIASATYTPLSRQSLPQVLSPTPPSSVQGGGPLFSTQPLSPLSSNSGVLPVSHGVASLAHSTPLSSVSQHPQQLVTNAGAGGSEVINSFAPATAAASRHSNSELAATLNASIVDGEEARQAEERPFRFKMLPPPPTIDRFLAQWDANAADARFRQWRRSDALSSSTNSNSNNAHAALNAQPGSAAASAGEAVVMVDRMGTLSAEDVLQRSAAAAKATIFMGSGGSGAAPVPRTMDERLALTEQYHRILERWWSYMYIFENKSEVQHRLGLLPSCPTYKQAQQLVLAKRPEVLPDEAVLQLTPEELTLETWSALALKWWEETKRRRRTRRGRRGSRRDAASSSATAHSLLNESQAQLDDDDDGAPHVEDDEAASEASGASFGMPSTEGSRHTRSLPDNDGYLNFDFTNQTTFGSPAESG